MTGVEVPYFPGEDLTEERVTLLHTAKWIGVSVTSNKNELLKINEHTDLGSKIEELNIDLRMKKYHYIEDLFDKE